MPTDLLAKIARLEAQLARVQSHLDDESMTRIQAQVALGSAEEQLALALDAARLATWQWNLLDRTIHFNPRWSEIVHGVSMPADVPDQDWMASIHPEDLPLLQETLMQVARRKRSRFLAQFRYQTRGKTASDWLWIEMIGVLKSSHFERDGADSASNKTIIGCASDITARKNHLDELKTARAKAEHASRSKTEFLAHVSHELRTPLHAVLGMAELLESQQQPALSRQQTEQLGVLKQSADHVLALVNDLLDFSSFERGQTQALPFQANYEPIDAHPWLNGLCAPFQQRAQTLGFVFTVVPPRQQPCFLKLERRRTTQVVNNLLSNAFKFTQRGAVSATFEVLDGQLHIRVQDTGIGIAADKLDDIFKAFTQADSGIQRQYGGTGLGLAISQRICQQLGGQLTVQSTLGQGSLFSAAIPVEVLELLTTRPVVARAHPSALRSDISVLLVDDNVVNLRVAQAFLNQHGIVGSTCESAAQGLEMLRRQVFDVIIVDLQMPVMSGFEMLVQGRAAHPSCVWIASTAHASPGYEGQCLSAGFDGFLAKPFSASQLHQALLGVPSKPRKLASLPAFDLQTFMTRFGFDAQLMQELAQALKTDAPARIQAMRLALDQQTFDDIKRQAHALKGAFSQLGDVRVPHLCLTLESHPESCNALLIDEIEAAVLAVVQAVSKVASAG